MGLLDYLKMLISGVKVVLICIFFVLLGFKPAYEDSFYYEILQHKNDFGLIFISNNNCSFCVEQEKVLSIFEQKYSWLIQKYDVFLNKKEIEGIGQDIKLTPTIFLITKEEKKILVVSEGYISMNNLELSLFKFLKKVKLI